MLFARQGRLRCTSKSASARVGRFPKPALKHAVASQKKRERELASVPIPLCKLSEGKQHTHDERRGKY